MNQEIINEIISDYSGNFISKVLENYEFQYVDPIKNEGIFLSIFDKRYVEDERDLENSYITLWEDRTKLSPIYSFGVIYSEEPTSLRYDFVEFEGFKSYVECIIKSISYIVEQTFLEEWDDKMNYQLEKEIDAIEKKISI